MAKVPPIKELEVICGGEGRGSDEPATYRIVYARLVRKLSIRITWILLHTKASANQVTVFGILLGLIGAASLTQNNVWAFVVGIALLQLSFVVDFSDGEVARYRGDRNAGGAYLDWIGHYYVPAAAVAAIAYATWKDSGHDWVLLAAFVLIIGLVRVAYSARDHVLLGLYRDNPELRTDDEYLRAVLARQGGDPNQIQTDVDYEERRSGTQGRGILWHRFTNLGQVLVYPGLVNILTVALVVDLIISVGDGDYPRVTESLARLLLIGVLGVVQLAHQFRAILQSFATLKRLF